MENQHFLDQDEINVTNERPTFLVVLCIITFIVSGFMLLSSIYGLFTYDPQVQMEEFEEAIVAMEKLGDNLPGMDEGIRAMEVFNQEQMDNHTLIQYTGLFSAILSLLGAFMMYSLNKIGFHLYLSSKVIGLIPLLVLTLSTPVFMTYGIFLFFTAAFVVMYAINLKSMK